MNKKSIPALIEEMANDLKIVIASRYPTKKVEIIELKACEDVVKVSFSVGDKTSFAIDMAVV